MASRRPQFGEDSHSDRARVGIMMLWGTVQRELECGIPRQCADKDKARIIRRKNRPRFEQRSE
jgi:hypothetical protein